MLHDNVTPYNTKDQKKDQVKSMFDNIAERYDFLNSLLSFGIHKGWRKKCVKIFSDKKPKFILDVATGTADFAIECAKLNPEKIIGIDISDGMIEEGRKKILKRRLENFIKLENANAETYSGYENYFDAIVIGFGVRNFQNLEAGLININRMLKPMGLLVILEFSYPSNLIIKAFYNFYFSYITPLVGKIFSKDIRAYSYLTESVKAFPHNHHFVSILEKCGYKNCRYKTLSFGVAAIYIARKG